MGFEIWGRRLEPATPSVALPATGWLRLRLELHVLEVHADLHPAAAGEVARRALGVGLDLDGPGLLDARVGHDLEAVERGVAPAPGNRDVHGDRAARGDGDVVESVRDPQGLTARRPTPSDRLGGIGGSDIKLPL